jgi:CheY-like chemotaxis protein
VVLEITDRKRLEVESQRRADDLAEADRRKDEFLATLAHELRNPLAPIRNGLEILRLKGDQKLERTRARDMMDRQVARMARLVDDLLDVSRITRGMIELRREKVPVDVAVAASVEAARPLIEERGHRLRIDLPPTALVLDADPTRLEQVITNLLTNAAKYTSRGGDILLRAEKAGREAVLRVRDTGIGIRPEMLPRVFDLFQQADRLPGVASDGLGIGLTLVRRLVNLHGGSVAVRSDGPEKGSEFEVRWPLASEAHPDPDDVTLPAKASERKLRILVCDDNVDAAETFAQLLEFQNHAVRVTHNGRDALAAAEENKPEVVFLDIGLPGGMDGYQVARRLRAIPGLARILVVAMTGYGQEDDRRRAREAGFDAHLVKPAEMNDVFELLDDVGRRVARRDRS